VDLQLNGRRAIVTGGSRGIGLAVARVLAAEGARVALVARGVEALSAAAEEVGGLAVPTDTGSDESVAAMVACVVEAFGGVDILVNAAATPNQGGFPEESLVEHLNVKVSGYLRCARAVAPLMGEQGWGRIVNVSGLAARQTGSVVGSVRNVAVAAMTKNLADELGPQGINVTVVHPGATVTEHTPPAELAERVSIGRLVTAAEVADVVAFLASGAARWITGASLPVDGGMALTEHPHLLEQPTQAT
jgi:NAD(P)-dependent dehydrogenase (short-subunit alcohol dehydrogenase family)